MFFCEFCMEKMSLDTENHETGIYIEVTENTDR